MNKLTPLGAITVLHTAGRLRFEPQDKNSFQLKSTFYFKIGTSTRKNSMPNLKLVQVKNETVNEFIHIRYMR